MVNSIVRDNIDIENNPLFYKDIEKINTFPEMCELFKYYNYISLHQRRFMFVARNKFGNKYSTFFFKKQFKELNSVEKMYICYYIFCFDLEKCYHDFQYESNFNVFKKMKITEYYIFLTQIEELHKKNKKKYERLLNQYNENYKEKNKKTYLPHEDPLTPIGTFVGYNSLNNCIKIKENNDKYLQKLKKEQEKNLKIVESIDLEYSKKNNVSIFKKMIKLKILLQ